MAQHARPKQANVRAHSHRRTPTRPGHRTLARTVALTMTGTLTASAAVLAAGASATAAGPISQAEGRFLGGSALGVDLTDIVNVDSADATNTGTPATVSELNPLGIAALNAVNVDIGPVNLLGSNGILSLGAVNQYARAKSDGSSLAATGAVSDSGAIAVGGSAGTPANASVDLSDLLGAGAAGLVSDLSLDVGALSARAAQAAGKNGAQSGTYQIADLGLTLHSPALSSILSDLSTTLGGLEGSVTGLLAGLDAADLLDVLDFTGITVPDLTNGADALQAVNSPGSTLVLDLQDGSLKIDVEELLQRAGLDLNDLPVNTNLLPYILDAVTDLLPGLVDEVLDNLTSDLTNKFAPTQGLIDGQLGPLQLLLQPVFDLVVDPVLAAVSDAKAGVPVGLPTNLDGVLDDALDLVANVQSTASGLFTQRALRVGVADAAIVNLASATVGPNAGPLALAPPVITRPADNSTTEDTTPTIAGTGKAGLTVTVVEKGKTVCTATVSSTGKWNCIPGSAMALAKHTITATQKSATQTSAASDPDHFTIVAPGDDDLPATGAGESAPLAAAGLLLLLAGSGLVAAPTMAQAGNGRHRRGRHAKR